MKAAGTAILTLMIIHAGEGLFAQTVQEKFIDYRKKAAQEKIYVHSDQETYVTGETMHVSVYLVDGSLHHRADLSKVAYIELIDAAQSSVVQAKISLKEGRGAGSMFLPATLNSGNYVLRAYTRWMKNYRSDYFFQKQISVVNTFIKLDTPPIVKEELDIQFFPEGGNFVDGLETNVGFKVADAHGRGVPFRGSLVGEGNDTLLRFQPLRFGMGTFRYRPEGGKKVRAVIHTKQQRRIVELPAAAPKGYLLSLTSDGSQLRVDVRSSPEFAGSKLYLFAHSRLVVVKALELMLTGTTASIGLSVSDLPEGITHFTLFDGVQQPVCERLYFKAPSAKLNITAATEVAEYGTRREVALNLMASSTSSASVSVYKLDSLSSFAESRILEYIWLTSDLQGFIESPEFYFTGTDEARAAADNLMLTQGWRKFDWNVVLSGKLSFEYVPENYGHIIEGLVRNNAGDTASSIRTSLSSPHKIINIYGSISDQKGRVFYDVQNMYGPRKLVIFNGGGASVKLLSPFSEKSPSFKLQPFTLSATTARDVLERSVEMQVKNIYFEEVVAKVYFDSTSFYGKADETYFLDDYTRFPVMEEVLREYVPGVMVRKNKNGFHFLVPNVVSGGALEEPIILLDGVPIPEVDDIMAFDPLRISKLEVVKKTFYNGLSRLPGIVSFTTYDGDMGGFELDERYVTIDFEGLNLRRELYTPNYDKQRYENLPDPRTLLYWNPSLSLEKDSSVRLKFFTSDIAGKYIVVVDGLGNDGLVGSKTFQFSVKQ